MPLVVPVNVRTAEEADQPGNRTAFAGISVPGGMDTVPRRLPGTVEATTLLKSASHRTAIRDYLDRTPAGVLQVGHSIASEPARVKPVASSVVLRHELSFDGATATHVRPVMFCCERFPLAVLCVTYRETMTACFVTDPALPGLDDLHHRWRQAVLS